MSVSRRPHARLRADAGRLFVSKEGQKLDVQARKICQNSAQDALDKVARIMMTSRLQETRPQVSDTCENQRPDVRMHVRCVPDTHEHAHCNMIGAMPGRNIFFWNFQGSASELGELPMMGTWSRSFQGVSLP